MTRFDWTPEVYLERIRALVPRYDGLQEQAIAAIPFRPSASWSWGWARGRRPAV